MHFFTTCLILAALASGTNGSTEPVASEVFRCDFEADLDRNYDFWPDDWTRRRDRDHPDYVQIGIVPLPPAYAPAKVPGLFLSRLTERQSAAVVGDATAAAQRCLAIQLDGGAGAATSPPIPVSTRYSFLLEARVRTAGLKHDAAQVTLSLYDESGVLLEQHASNFIQARDWLPVRLGPVAPNDPRVKHAKITLSLGPTGTNEDLTGTAWFDELRVLQVPRMQLRTGNPTGLYLQPSGAEVICEVSGVTEADPRVIFELFDHTQTKLAGETKQVTEIRKPKPPPGSASTASEPFAGKAAWMPPIPDYGFYQVRVTMPLSGGASLERTVTLAVLRPLAGSGSGEFGWSLPGGEQPLALEELGPMLGNVGIHWAKFPVWHHDPNDAWTDRLAWFAERLSLQGIEMVGLLDHPPNKPGVGSPDNEHPPIASLFIESGIWDDAVEPLMTRLSLKVRWWQLGGDDDTSFVGLPDVDKKISDVKGQFQRFGQEIRLGIPWSWVAQPPDDRRAPWEFLSLTTEPPLTADEIALYLERSKPAVDAPVASLGQSPRSTPASAASDTDLTAAAETGVRANGRLLLTSTTRKQEPLVAAPKRWIILAPLDRDTYALPDRIQDLVMRMLAAKIHGADAVFVPQPFHARQGLMNEDGTPGELLVPWRTMAMTISGAEYLGQIQLPGGSTNHVFARGREAFMVLWNDQPTQEQLSLGDELRQMDLWGRDLKVETAEQDGQHVHVVAVGPQPTIVSGLNEGVARWQIELSFDNPRLASVFGMAQPLTMRVPNRFGQAVGGEITIRTPRSWDVNPRVQRFKVAEGDELKQTFPVTLHSDATSGSQPVEIDFEVIADRNYRFRVYRTLQLGLEGLSLELKTRLSGDDLVVEQTITNLTEERLSLQCMLFPPGRRRETKQVIQLSKGRTVVTFTLPDGRSLLGETIRLRAEEIGGARVLNSAVVAER